MKTRKASSLMIKLILISSLKLQVNDHWNESISRVYKKVLHFNFHMALEFISPDELSWSFFPIYYSHSQLEGFSHFISTSLSSSMINI